jgi:hypothetical protein
LTDNWEVQRIQLRQVRRVSKNVPVKRLKPIVAMLMFALFAFASSHPLLEGLGLIHHEVAHAEEPAGPHSDHQFADGKCPIHSSRDEIQNNFSNGGFNLGVVAMACVVLHHADLETRPSVEIASSPPPELGTSWQFSSRTALPVRAPSFGS